MMPLGSQPTICPGCGVHLPDHEGPTHRYVGASAACWALFSSLLNAGEPALAPAPMNALIGDAYPVQHPGTPSKQAIQSVAVHLLVLYGVLDQRVQPSNALWVRQRALREIAGTRQDRFEWLVPPRLDGQLTIVDIIQAATPTERSQQAQSYVEQIWQVWSRTHLPAVADWYARFVLPDRL